MKNTISKFVLAAFCCSLMLQFSCDEVDVESTEIGNVQGLWQLGTNNSYLLISDQEVVYYSFNASKNCTTSDPYQVVRIDGTGFYILTQEGLEENVVLALTFDGTYLAVRDIDDTHREIKWYQPSDIDISILGQECVSESDVFGNWESTLDNEFATYLSITLDSISSSIL